MMMKTSAFLILGSLLALSACGTDQPELVSGVAKHSSFLNADQRSEVIEDTGTGKRYLLANPVLSAEPPHADEVLFRYTGKVLETSESGLTKLELWETTFLPVTFQP